MTQQIIHNRYAIIRDIKKGGMGSVVLVEDKSLEKKVVIKQLNPDSFPANERLEIEKAFQREAKILANLDHPGLPRVTDIFSDSTGYYLVMDYIEGEDLEEFKKKRGDLSDEEVIKWSIEILVILDFLHHQNPPIIYRDVKPANVMLTKDGQIKLIDFGIARKIEEETYTRKLANKQTAIGTPGFAPWEQYAGKAEPRSDIYSLGVTMYYLLTGVQPIGIDIKPILSLRPNTGSALAGIIKKATDSRLDERFASAREMKEALVGISNGQKSSSLVVPNTLPDDDPIMEMIEYLELSNRQTRVFNCDYNVDLFYDHIKEIKNLYQRQGTRKIGQKKFYQLINRLCLVQARYYCQSELSINFSQHTLLFLWERLAKLAEQNNQPAKALKYYQKICKYKKNDSVYDNISRLNMIVQPQSKDWWKKILLSPLVYFIMTVTFYGSLRFIPIWSEYYLIPFYLGHVFLFLTSTMIRYHLETNE